jgi:hypothetical protein
VLCGLGRCKLRRAPSHHQVSTSATTPVSLQQDTLLHYKRRFASFTCSLCCIDREDVPPIHGQTQPWLDFDSRPCNAALCVNSPAPDHGSKMYANIADAAA